MNPFITSDDFNRRASFEDSDENRYSDDYSSLYDEIVDNPGVYALDAIHAEEHIDDILYSVIQYALADNRPINERFYDIQSICEKLINNYAKKEQYNV